MLVVAYDVADDRRRIRLHTLLLGYGEAVQESVFECELTPRHARALKQRVRRIVRPGIDHVRYYSLCEACAARTGDETGQLVPSPNIVHVV